MLFGDEADQFLLLSLRDPGRDADVLVIDRQAVGPEGGGDLVGVDRAVEVPLGVGVGLDGDRTLGDLGGQVQEVGPLGNLELAEPLGFAPKKAAQTYGKKDFNALYRLVLSAGIAFDKAFPQVQAPAATNLVFQLFGSLGRDTTIKILEPARPIIDVTPQATQEIPSERPLGSEPSVQSVGSNTSPEGPQTPVGYIPNSNEVEGDT